MSESGIFQHGLSMAVLFLQNSFRQTSDISSSVYESCVKAARTFWRDVKRFICVEKAFFAICVVSASYILLLTACVMIVPYLEDFIVLMFVITAVLMGLPIVNWRISQLHRRELRARWRQDGESCPHQTVTDKPPEYESLVFASAGPVTSCAAPPTYEEAIPVAEETRILPPEYSRCTNVAVSLCPVHQHSTSRHPGVVQQETRTHRSKSLGDLCDHDSELLLA
ncbi:uncharacterized protein LOC124374669 isoform X2 [Homalodisca vitripennis]|uniref:uncharacterized protein LOC124374669 isoform X2 n=1 Tax=Homalodisca vitripennis TaxID=197043 RepID=UPI001EE9C3D4|nr:uncharacterized protein LOC124374669 isoform X2 [Homalodisca vitripennis]